MLACIDGLFIGLATYINWKCQVRKKPLLIVHLTVIQSHKYIHILYCPTPFKLPLWVVCFPQADCSILDRNTSASGWWLYVRLFHSFCFHTNIIRSKIVLSCNCHQVLAHGGIESDLTTTSHWSTHIHCRCCSSVFLIFWACEPLKQRNEGSLCLGVTGNTI